MLRAAADHAGSQLSVGAKAAVLAIGLTLLLPALGGLWKAASLRADLFQKWDSRIAVTAEGLSEAAARELLAIQDEIADATTGMSISFNPVKIVEDPARLSAPMARFQELIRVRDRLAGQLSALLALGPILIVLTPLYGLGVCFADLYFAQIHHVAFLGWTGVGLAGATALGALSCVAAYSYLHQRISGAEIMAARVTARD